MDSNPVWVDVLIRKGKDRHGGTMWRQKQRLQLGCQKPRNTWVHQKPEEAKKEEILSKKCWRKYGPTSTLILDFESPDYEKINLCCLKPPFLWYPRKLLQWQAEFLEGCYVHLVEEGIISLADEAWDNWISTTKEWSWTPATHQI